MFVYESVPGTTVLNMKVDTGRMEFAVEGTENTQITVEMEAECEYKVTIDREVAGFIDSNLGGKVSFSADLNPDKAVQVKIEKI